MLTCVTKIIQKREDSLKHKQEKENRGNTLTCVGLKLPKVFK